MTKQNQLTKLTTASLEKLFLKGDLSVLSPEEKMSYYNEYCNRLGLDPFTQPFKLLKLNGKETLYCDRSGTQQLSKLHGVSHEIKSREVINDCYVVTAKASTNGRSTESIGAVSIAGAKGDVLCNAMMKAETKAKRRATLDLLGLGVLDETEIETIPNATTSTIELKESGKDQAINRLKSSTNITDLAAQYNVLSNDLKKDLDIMKLKEERKSELTPMPNGKIIDVKQTV